jgi:hypothetical protein
MLANVQDKNLSLIMNENFLRPAWRMDVKNYSSVNATGVGLQGFGAPAGGVKNSPAPSWKSAAAAISHMSLGESEILTESDSGPGDIEKCHQFLHVIQVREPIARAISHLEHLSELAEKRSYYSSLVPVKFSELLDTAPAIMNNIIIRTLLGHDVWNLPLGAITRQHLDLAKQVLVQQFDVVLILGKTEEEKVFLQRGMGWSDGNCERVSSRVSGRNHDTSKRHEGIYATDAELDRKRAAFEVERMEHLEKLGKFIARATRVNVTTNGATKASEAEGGGKDQKTKGGKRKNGRHRKASEVKNARASKLKSTKSKVSSNKVPSRFSRWALEIDREPARLMALNALDIELFQFSSHLSLLDYATLLAAEKVLGPVAATPMRTSSCGYTCLARADT